MSEKPLSPDYSFEAFRSMGDEELAYTWRVLRPQMWAASRKANDAEVGDPDFSRFLAFLETKEMPTAQSSLDKGYPLLFKARMEVR